MKTRQSYEPALKKEIAEGYYTRKLTAKDIEAKGIRMNNVYRWVHEFFGAGARTKGEPALEAVTPEATPATPSIDIHTLSRRKIKRGANGRYPDKVRDTVMAALLEKSVPEVSEITGIQPATLYLWRDAAQKQRRANGGGGALVVAKEKHSAVPANGEPRTAEVIINPASTEVILANIRKGEGFANLDKAVKQLKAAHRSGQIEDYDEIDLRFLLGFRLLTGAPLRARK